MHNNKSSVVLFLIFSFGLIVGFLGGNLNLKIGQGQLSQVVSNDELIKSPVPFYSFDKRQSQEIMQNISSVVFKYVPSEIIKSIYNNTSYEKQIVFCVQRVWENGGWTTYSWFEFGSWGNFGGYACIPIFL